MDENLLAILGFQISVVAAIDLVLREIGSTPEGPVYLLIWGGVLITLTSIILQHFSSD